MNSSFIQKLTGAIERNNSLLCVGLDPDLSRITGDPGSDEEKLVRWGLEIIEQTADLACCYKPNIAFYEQYGPQGLSALRHIIAAVPDDIPVLLDAKRGDIGHTAAAYARAAFEMLGVDAITTSPYLGSDTVAPFLAYEGKTVFLLCHTSNPSAAEIQHFGDAPLYRHVARLGQTWGSATQIGFVAGATQPEALAQVRRLAPERWILAPGVGAQGGDLAAAMAAGLNADGSGVIVPVSRSIIYADDPRQAAMNLRDRINHHRPAAGAHTPHKALILALHEAGCVQFGKFTLSSGHSSPVYVDLRRVVSYPALFRRVVDTYISISNDLHFDYLTGVPYGALPIASAVALRTSKPLVYPRKESKAYGIARDVEGVFERGARVLVFEDVVTSGNSLLHAIEALEAAGLIVRDTVVLVDRKQGGWERLSNRGYRLHALLTMHEILDTLHREERISTPVHQQAKTYLETTRVSS